MDKSKFYCGNPACENEIPEPEMCCDGRECGCMGQPIDPSFCSNECMYVVYPHTKPPDLKAKEKEVESDL